MQQPFDSKDVKHELYVTCTRRLELKSAPKSTDAAASGGARRCPPRRHPRPTVSHLRSTFGQAPSVEVQLSTGSPEEQPASQPLDKQPAGAAHGEVWKKWERLRLAGRAFELQLSIMKTCIDDGEAPPALRATRPSRI